MPLRKGAVSKAFAFPVKGLDEGWAENAQPQGTSPRLRNCVPFHPTSGRAGGGPRGGSILKATINAGHPIQCMRQVTAITEEAAGGSTTSDDFTYGLQDASYEQFPLQDMVDGSANPLWEVRFGTLAGPLAAALGGTVDVGDGELVDIYIQPTGNTDVAYPTDTPSYVQFGVSASADVAKYIGPDEVDLSGNDFTLQIEVASPGGLVGVMCRVSGTPSSTANVVTLQIRDNRYVDLIEGSTTIDTWDSGSAGLATVHPPTVDTLKLECSGNTFNGYYNGTLRVTGSCTGDPTATGYAIGGNDSSNIYNLEIVVNGTPVEGGARSVSLVVVSGGNIYIGDFVNGFHIPTGGTGALSATARVQATDLLSKVYFADGSGAIQVLDIDADTVSDLTAAVGKGTAPTNARLVTVYRERLCVAGVRDDSQNLFMSRQGDPTDWDYGQDDAQAAVALNASSTSGRVGSPILALAPFRDDTMLIFCDHQLYKMSGDPAPEAGGSIDTVSDLVGILDPNAWTFDTGSVIHFLGTGGLYRYDGQGEPECISRNRVNKRFSSLTRASSHYFGLCWDRDLDGLWIFDALNSGGGQHYWWDERFEAFFPFDVPDDQGPRVAIVFDGDGPTDRYLLLGGLDGCIYELGAAHTHDQTAADGNLAIESSCVCGPMNFADVWSRAAILSTQAVLGRATTNVDWAIYGGTDCIDALDQLDATNDLMSGTFTSGGRQARNHTRGRASAFLLELSNDVIDTTWSFEQFVAEVEEAGPAR